MKLILISLITLSATMLTGCGSCSRSAAYLTGYSRTCVGGVSYLQFPSGVTPEYQADGKLKTCSND